MLSELEVASSNLAGSTRFCFDFKDLFDWNPSSLGPSPIFGN